MEDQKDVDRFITTFLSLTLSLLEMYVVIPSPAVEVEAHRSTDVL